MKKPKYPAIRVEMTKKGETLEDLAKILDLNISSVSQRIRGNTEWTIGEVEVLLKHYNKDFWELFMEGEKNEKENI